MVTNSTVDGVLAALFALLIIIVILDASRIWVSVMRAREPLPTTEAVRAVADRRAGRLPEREARSGGGAARRFTRDEPEPGGGHDRERGFAGVRWYLREVAGERATTATSSTRGATIPTSR